MKKTKNVKLSITDAMQANFMVYFEERFKNYEKMTPKLFSNLYSHIQETKLYYMVPFSELEQSDMGWVVKKKKSIFILDEHVVAFEENLPEKYKGHVIMSKAVKSEHKWDYLPQIPKALQVAINVTLECDKKHDEPFAHIGNVAEGIIVQKVSANNKRDHVLKHLQAGKWITDKEFHQLSKRKDLIRIVKDN
jgi:hypothetical protein